MEYRFGKAEKSETAEIFRLYEKRVHWMDDVGIRQWNVTGYLTAYPLAYYQKEQEEGALYVLREKKTGRPVGAVVLLSSDAGWEDSDTVPAFYLHRLVTDPAVCGAGKILVAEAEWLAKAAGKARVRLDCAADSVFLNRYYESLGYLPVGRCTDGPYIGIRREKILPTDSGQPASSPDGTPSSGKNRRNVTV